MAEKESSKKGFFGKLISAISGAPMASENASEERGQFAPKKIEPLDERFVQEFTKNGGNFVYCGTKEELIVSLRSVISEQDLLAVGSPDDNLYSFLKSNGISKTQADVKECDAICTYCEALIAYNGGIMINEHQTKGMRIDDMPKYHIAIGKTSQLVEKLGDAMSRINHQYRNNRPGQISVLKGPKDENVRMASADPNKDRVLFLLLVEDSF